MKHSMKGALLSGLVVPGLGQIVLKQYRRGIVLMLTVVAALTVIVVKAVARALTILDEIESGGGPIDERAISGVVSQAITPADSLMVNGLLLVIGVCWIYGIVDAYRIGKKKEMEG